MPLEVVVELQIRAISCPGVFLPDKQDVYLGVYLLNQYLETNCFPSVFPIMIQQRMRFQKLFENAIDPGAVADILESILTRFELIQLVHPVWEELAYYEENTREFLFPEPKLTPSIPGIGREVLMKTAAGFPGIAPKIEFSTRTAIRECVFLHRNRFLEEMFKSRRPLFTSYGPTFPLKNKHRKRREINLNRLPQCVQFWEPSPYSTRRCFQDQTAQLNLGNNFRIPGESKPPFVVRHVDSAKPFGEDISEHYSRKSRRKSKFPNFPFPMRRVMRAMGSHGYYNLIVELRRTEKLGERVAVTQGSFKSDSVTYKGAFTTSSLDSLAANVKVIKEPDERIFLRHQSPSPLCRRKFRKPSPSYSNQGDADFHLGTSFATSRHSRSPSPPLDQSCLRGSRFHPGSQSTWKKIHERVCNLLTSHRARQHLNEEDFISDVNYTLERPSYPLKNYPVHAQRYF